MYPCAVACIRYFWKFNFFSTKRWSCLLPDLIKELKQFSYSFRTKLMPNINFGVVVPCLKTWQLSFMVNDRWDQYLSLIFSLSLFHVDEDIVIELYNMLAWFAYGEIRWKIIKSCLKGGKTGYKSTKITGVGPCGYITKSGLNPLSSKGHYN